MAEATSSEQIVIKGGHVIDPAQGIDRITDVVMENGRIVRVGDGPVPEAAEVVDATGHYVSPGFIDIHIHAYGTLGFADPDSLGIWQGVTSFVEAGGPGIGTFDEFLAMLAGRTVTDLYAGLWLRPMGLIGVNYIEGDARTLMEISIAKWMDAVAEHGDVLRYVKIGAFGRYGTGPIKMGKGLAEVVGLPAYFHIGEFQEVPPQITTAAAFRAAGPGDMITHVYHGNPGGTLDDDGKVLDAVRDAERRGVLFDVGFGGYNFSWRVAERAYAQGLVPHIISSDLQQHNVNGPVYSLANVMSVMLHLGLTLNEVIERVTIAPARAISIDNRAGTLGHGMPADVTVFKVVDGEVELSDCQLISRTADRTVVPVMAFKNGVRYDTDLMRCRDEKNWFWQIAEDAIPARAAALDARQRKFLAALARKLEPETWKIESAERLDIYAAINLQDLFHEVRAGVSIPLRDALDAVYASFLASPFTMQIGLFLFRLEKDFAIERMRAVANASDTVAAE
jgi:dihydroorotase